MFRTRLARAQAAPALAVPARTWSRSLLGTQTSVRSVVTSRATTSRKDGGLRNYWGKERLATTEAFPLSQELAEHMTPGRDSNEVHKTRSPWQKKVRVSGATGSQAYLRTQIVSPALCDDVLAYYGDSLERHRGCDILDINPGAGLWSQKLHDFLEPRSHVLLEPRPDIFAPFLDPLVSAPGSRYQIIQKDTKELQAYRDLVDDNVFPHQTRIDPDSTGAHKVNDTLLVTGSLNWEPRLPGLNFDSMAKQLLHHFASAAWTHDLFHAYGRVRVLMWTNYDDCRPMLAEGIASNFKGNVFLEMTHKLEFVVVSPHRDRQIGRAAPGREPNHEIESTVRAMQRGREAGKELPSHRRAPIHDFADDFAQQTGGSGITSSAFTTTYLQRKLQQGVVPTGLLTQSMISTHLELQELAARFPELELASVFEARDVGTPVPKRASSFAKHPAKKELHSFSVKRSTARRHMKIKEDVEAIGDVGIELYNSECKAIGMEDGPEKTALLERIESLKEQWSTGVSSLPENYSSTPYNEVDDRLALRSPPHPRTQWDRRAFEPLVAKAEEAWPTNRLALLSMEPTLLPEDATPDWYEWMHDFVYGLMATPLEPLPEALDKMQHGMRDIMSRCPSLRDPAKGGRLNLEHLRVRMLTAEMLLELCAAYRRWPFKAPGTDHNKYYRYRGTVKGKGIYE